MSKSTRRIRKLCHHKASGRAMVTLPGRGDVYCGPWGSEEASAAYRATIAEWLSSGAVSERRTAAPQVTVVEVCAAYLQYLEEARARASMRSAAKGGEWRFSVTFTGEPRPMSLDRAAWRPSGKSILIASCAGTPSIITSGISAVHSAVPHRWKASTRQSFMAWPP